MHRFNSSRLVTCQLAPRRPSTNAVAIIRYKPRIDSQGSHYILTWLPSPSYCIQGESNLFRIFPPMLSLKLYNHGGKYPDRHWYKKRYGPGSPMNSLLISSLVGYIFSFHVINFLLLFRTDHSHEMNVHFR